MTPDTFPSLFWAYTSVWILLAVYIITLGVRMRKVEMRLREVLREGSPPQS
jgi:CcmD family protein